MSENIIKNILRGQISPIYWKDILNYASDIEQKYKIRNFPRYALKTLFVGQKNADVCLHYNPKKTNNHRGKDPNAEYTKDEYKGPPNTEKNKWIATSRIIKIQKDSIIIQDRTKKTKQNVSDENGNKVERMAHPIKKMLIDRIKDITNNDNSRVDFSKYLRNVDINDIIRKTYRKNMSLKQDFKKEIQKLSKTAAADITNDPHKNKVVEKTPLQNLALVHKDTKQRLQDYWSYLDTNFARSMTKDY